jgi:hypothetical protein
MTTSTTQCFPFFTPILDTVLDMEEEERRTLPRERKRKGKKDVENEARETQNTSSNVSFSGSCALNAEINGKFILLRDDEKRNTGGETIKPDASRIVALDDLWRKEEDKEETDEEEAKKFFVKSLASVNVTSEEEGTTRVVDVRASAEKYWERETVDRSGGEGEGSDDEKTLGAKNFIVEAASRNGGVVGEKFLFERLERVFPQTVFARAPVESFVFEGDDDDCEEEEEEEEEERKQQQKQNRYKYDAIVYNASDETSKFRYHIDGDPMTLLHPKSAFAEAYGGNYANRAPMGYAKNKNEKVCIKPRFISLLVYLNDEWDPEWGGETKFLDEDSQIGLLVAAKPGRVVLFDSDVKHSACATTMPPRDDESNNKNKKRFSLVMKLIALPKKVLLNEEKNEDDDKEEEEEEVDLLRVNPNLGFGAATPIGSAKRLRDVVEAFSRKSSIK